MGNTKARARNNNYRRKTKNAKKNSTGRIYVAIIMLFMIGLMSFKIIKLYQKNESYKATEASLEKQVSEATETKQELEEREEYVGSDEYVEDEASKKLGLTYDNWIIFREKED